MLYGSDPWGSETDQKLVPDIRNLSSVLLQPSKRSAANLCGRNDGNLKVIFADVEMEDATDSGLRVRAQPGDYVLVKVRSSFCAFDLHCEMGVGLDNLRE